MERTVKLVLAYDGTDFHGWQAQPGLRTAQGELEAALARVIRHPVSLAGASRTDSGVHARGQVARVLTSCPLPSDRLRHAVEHRLPEDMALIHAMDVPAGFHATRDARSKLYRYTIHNTHRRPVPQFATRYCWHMWHKLDVERMACGGGGVCGSPRLRRLSEQMAASARRTVRSILRVGVQQRYHQVLDRRGR